MNNLRRRKPLRAPVKKADTRWNGAKEQLSLEMGSAEYRAYLNDRRGIEDRDFVQDDRVLDDGDTRVSDEAQEAPPEPEHVAELAEDLKDAAVSAQVRAKAVTDERYRRQMSKVSQTGRMFETAASMAAETPTEADDKAVASASRRCAFDLPDVKDDGVSEEEYIPRSLQRYL